MRLLTKQEIHRKQTDDLRIQIEEGVKIAKKVDELRTTLATEQKTVQTFTTSTQAVLLQQITELVERRDSIEIEISNLEKERKELLKPLDTEWDRLNKNWEKFYAKESILLEKEKQLNSDIKAVVSKVKRLDQQEAKIALVERNIEQKQSTADEYMKQALEAQNEAHSTLDKAKAVATTIEKDAKKLIEENLVIRSNLQLKEQSLRRLEKALADKERLVNDRYATLLATEKEYGSKRSNRQR